MLNKVILIGRLGADPEVRFMPSGDQITTIRLVTNRRWKDKNTNERKEEAEFHRITFFGGLAKVAGEYLKKGSQAYVEGRIKTTKYEKNGQDHYSTGIIGEAMNMLDAKNSQNDGGNQNNDHSQPSNGQANNHNDFDDDIPF